MRKIKAIWAIIRCDSMFVVTRRGEDCQEFLPGPMSLTAMRAEKCCQRLHEQLREDLAEVSEAFKRHQLGDGPLPWDLILGPEA